jgi:hypothetical protein
MSDQTNEPKRRAARTLINPNYRYRRLVSTGIYRYRRFIFLLFILSLSSQERSCYTTIPSLTSIYEKNMQVHPNGDGNYAGIDVLRKPESVDEENQKGDLSQLTKVRESQETESVKDDDAGPKMHTMEHIADLFSWENNTLTHKHFAVFIFFIQGLLLLYVLLFQTPGNGWVLGLVSLPLTAVILFKNIWDDFLESLASFLLFSDRIKRKKNEEIPATYEDMITVLLKMWEVLFVIYVVFASIFVSLSQPDVLNVALNCTGVMIVCDLDEAILKFLDLKVELAKDELTKKEEMSKEKFRLLEETVTLPVLKIGVVVLYVVGYILGLAIANGK